MDADAGRGTGALEDPLALAVIPARLESRRLPRKMLLDRTGCHLFAHTARNVARCAAIARVVVATDAAEVLEAARGAGVEALMTRADHPSGTDRVFEALGRLEPPPGRAWEVVVNVQGDEPDVDPADLARLVGAFADPAVEAATLWAAIEGEEEALDPSVVKVVCDARGDALYFSRSPIPSRVHARGPAAADVRLLRRHVGVYAFRPAALARFCSLPVGRLEAAESLEQLRWLEAGLALRTVQAAHVPRGIDTEEDYQRFVGRLAAAKRGTD
jgi:3-deoxy-manno-octulosonate cytidylyltransferase (CMP-KDO synthetase)